MIRSTIVVFSQDGFDWTDKLGSFDSHEEWIRQKSPGGAVRDEWDMVKHGDIVLKHLCETGDVAFTALTLFAAARAGSISTVRYLVEERGVDPAADGNNPFRIAAENGRMDVIQFLLDLPAERGVDPSSSNNSALSGAAVNGKKGVIELLLALPPERGVDPSAASVFNFAVESGNVDAVQLFLDLPLERGVDPAENDNSPLCYAAEHEYVDIVEALLELPPERGVDPMVAMNHLLLYAAELDIADIVKLILGMPLGWDKGHHKDTVEEHMAEGRTELVAIVRLLLRRSRKRRPSIADVQRVLSAFDSPIGPEVSKTLKKYIARSTRAPKRRKIDRS